MPYKRVKRKRVRHKHARPDTHAARAGLRYNDFDLCGGMSSTTSRPAGTKPKNNASLERAERFNDHTEDVP